METAEIRRRWLAFFESKGHAIVPSASLLYDDPNLLFVAPAWCRSSPTSWARRRPVEACHQRAEVRAHR
jgi:alanyl-tRNA synthetase